MRIVVASGSSGGHLFPALSFIKELKARDAATAILLILPEKGFAGRAADLPCEVKYIPVSPIRLRCDFKCAAAVFSFLKSSLKSVFIVSGFRPDVVVGFGSIPSLPAVMSAWLFRINTMIHEQNVIPGRANRFLAYFVDRIAVSFPQTALYFKAQGKKAVYTGNPIRAEMTRISKAEALEFFKFNKDKFTVLVMGGSQGSHRINVEFTDALSGLRDISNLQVIHITGLEDYSSLKEKYRFMGTRVQVFGFFSRMHYAYSACDLIISRAGAATVSEIIFFGLPALIIPYPHAYAHQSANAAILAEKRCASVIKDEELNAQLLKNRIEDFMAHPEKLQDMRSAYLGFAFNDPAGALADEVAALVSEDR